MQPEFSRIIDSDTLTTRTKDEEISASHTECTALAQRFKIEGLADFSARFHLARAASGDVRVDGSLSATVTLISTISLEPFTMDIKDEFTTLFKNSTEDGTDKDEGEISADDIDTEPLKDSKIDLGELASEYLALAIPPFPKKEGESFSFSQNKQETKDESHESNPFSALKNLK